MKHLFIALILFVFSYCSLSAQESISATLLDSTLQKPVPFATITINNSYGVVSNSSGHFVIHLKSGITEKDSLYISCMGFESKQIALKKFNDTIIILNLKNGIKKMFL